LHIVSFADLQISSQIIPHHPESAIGVTDSDTEFCLPLPTEFPE
jgi:hypothetical protein